MLFIFGPSGVHHVAADFIARSLHSGESTAYVYLLANIALSWSTFVGWVGGGRAGARAGWVGW